MLNYCYILYRGPHRNQEPHNCKWAHHLVVSVMRQSTKRPNLQKRMAATRKMAPKRMASQKNASQKNESEKPAEIEPPESPVPQTIGVGKANRRKYPLMIATVVVATLVASFQHFVLTLPQATTDRLQFTDGIVVMTGGQQRLDDGVRLLTEGFADKMLISGVGKGVNRAILVQELGLSEAQINALFCCVELDHAAQDTYGNARSAREWSRSHGMQSLRLVTANYHMPRTLLIFSRELPHVDLYQWPVSPDDLDLVNWWRDPASLRLLAREFAKYLTVYFSV